MGVLMMEPVRIDIEVVRGDVVLPGTLWVDPPILGDPPAARLRLRYDDADGGEVESLWFEREPDGVYRHRVPDDREEE
jgi:hypothetical protein